MNNGHSCNYIIYLSSIFQCLAKHEGLSIIMHGGAISKLLYGSTSAKAGGLYSRIDDKRTNHTITFASTKFEKKMHKLEFDRHIISPHE